ncbi:MAG: aspartyl-phosphate phosphatase Spo0E family protein [Clostridia bacterium]|nr:aspartyl-phosphate phosphatase Spo0E family protein [Clostridia bacterium]
MGQVDRIIFEIEELRKKLNSLIINEKNKFTDARVVELSQELDMVLNRYNQLMRNSK